MKRRRRLILTLAVIATLVPLWVLGRQAAYRNGYNLELNPRFWQVSVAYGRTDYGDIKVVSMGPVRYATRTDLMKARRCRHNLQQLQSALEQWAIEHKRGLGSVVRARDLIGAGRPLRALPTCRAGGTYPEKLELGAPLECSIGTAGDSDPENDHRIE